MGNGFGVTALIFGILSIPLTTSFFLFNAIFSMWGVFMGISNLGFIFQIIGWIFPALAIIFGIVGIIVDESKGKAIAGLVLGLVGLIIASLISFVYTSAFTWLMP